MDNTAGRTWVDHCGSRYGTFEHWC